MIDQPLQLPCGVTVKNRLAKSAMTEGLADEYDNPTQRLNTLYRRWAEGGIGLSLTGNVMVDRRYLERPGNVVIDNDTDEAALQDWSQAGSRSDTQLWMQISHPGRQCNRLANTHPIAPSAVPLKLGKMFGKPTAMSEQQVEDAINRYVHVAAVAKSTGFTGVQIHAAHGYLISQFLSPLSNRRDDQWGGDISARYRFLGEIIKRTRNAVGPEFPVAVKLNSADFQRGGFSPEESIQVAAWLDQAGIDLLEISGGNYEQPQLFNHEGLEQTTETLVRESTREREAYFLEYAAKIKEVVSVPLMVTGGFRSKEAMEAALDSGACDLIGIARPLCVDPGFPQKLIDGEIERLPSHEKDLPFKSKRFGPTSPWLIFKIINVQGEVTWFYRQIIRLANKQDANLGLGLLRGFLSHLITELNTARKRAFKPRAKQ